MLVTTKGQPSADVVALYARAGERPLVVDMDGTLLATDMLYESLCWAAGNSFLSLPRVPFWVMKGKAHFKAKMADLGGPPVDDVPLNQECLDLIAAARARGAKVVLASASNERIVKAVAERLGLFDEWYGSSASRNLSGKEKADLLVAKFGLKGFDYAGDSSADHAVWAVANRAYSFGASGRVRRALDGSHAQATHIKPRQGLAGIKPYLKALRPHQWAKNLLIFVPMLASHELTFAHVIAAMIAFIAFSLTASSVYVVNDLVDLGADRAHPRKRKRPFASGAIPILHGMIMAPLLLATAVSIAAAFLPPTFLLVLAGYYTMTAVYSFWLKQKVLIDIVLLAGLYTVRLIAGAEATMVEASPWMLAFSMFFFLALAVVKRQAELVDIIRANDGRAIKRGYRTDDLQLVQSLGAASGYVSVLVLALYINSVPADLLYKSPTILWGICPLLLYWISRMLLLASRGQMHDDPIVFTTKDHVSYLIGLAIALVVAASLLI